MKKLRLLQIHNTRSSKDLFRGNVQLLQSLSYLSNELRFLEWHGYHLKFLPNNFQPNKLVILRMCFSGIRQLWKGIMTLDELKLIDLSYSQNLIETPNFSRAPNLKKLILKGCTRLSKIHASLGNLKQLIQLDLNGCKCLKILPNKINLEALEIFDLGGCSRLEKFPEIVGNMPRLSTLCLNETPIKDLSLSVELVTGLIKLDLRDCKKLSSFPNAYCSLMSLKILILSGCSKIDELPKNLGNLIALEELDVSRTAIKVLPTSINLLKNLKELSLHGCGGLSPNSSNKLISFQRRSLYPMVMLEHSLSVLCSLTHLDLSFCNLQSIPDEIGTLSSLLELNLEGNNFICLPQSMIQLSNLKVLQLNFCTSLRSLPKLPLNIEGIDATSCTSLETFSIRPEDKFVPALDLTNCVKLIESQDYNDLLSGMLRRFIIDDQRHDKREEYYGLVIPGSKIPKWLSHKNVGTSVNLQVPSSDLFYNKLMGIVGSFVFVFRRHHPFDQLHTFNWGSNKYTHMLICSIYANGCEIGEKTYPESEKFGKIESCQLLLFFLPSINFELDWEEKLNGVDANGLTQIEVKFEAAGPGLEITKCGASLVFEQDIEDLKQTKAWPSSCSITPYKDDLDTNIKKSRDEAGPSGEATGSNDIDAPHPKWIQLPNLIQSLVLCLGNWLGNLCTPGKGNPDSVEEEFQ